MAIVGAGIALWNLLVVWRESERGWWSRLSAVAIAVACVDIVWVGFAYRLLTWSLEY